MLGPAQQRICGLSPPLPDSVDGLLARLRGVFRRAKSVGLLVNSLEQRSHGLLKKQAPISEELYEKERLLEPQHPRRQVAAIVGGEKNFHRLRTIPHFERDDGAWFDFRCCGTLSPSAVLCGLVGGGVREWMADNSIAML